MTKQAVDDVSFIELVTKLGPSATAKKIGISERGVLDRRQRLEQRLGIVIKSPTRPAGLTGANYPARLEFDIKNGVVLVGSDAHIWPGEVSTAMRAFIKFTKELKPAAVVLNGDVLDFGRISRHASIGWEARPMVHEEIEAAQDILHDLEMACGRGVQKVWPLGNHDSRFETRIANADPEYARIKGVHLSDHFPNWAKCWSTFINQNVVIKHRYKGGIHAPHNNTVNAGRTIVTGHLHSQKIIPFSDYNGTRWGVDTGCLAETDAPAFRDYTEDNPLNWRAGFCILTFKDGVLLPPELVTVWGKGKVVFRGQVVAV